MKVSTFNTRLWRKLSTALLLMVLVNASAQLQHANNLAYVIKQDSNGIYTNPYAFAPGNLYKKTSWTGSWIWLNKTKYPQYQSAEANWVRSTPNNNDKRYRVLFRKQITLKSLPKKALAFVTGDVSFELYVNGQWVCHGPSNIGSDYGDTAKPIHWFYTVEDIAKYLKAGNNIITAEVHSQNFVGSETTSIKAGFLCDVEVNGKVVAATDDTWKTKLDTAYFQQDGLVFDAQREPVNWKELNFVDAGWHKAMPTNKPINGYLVASKIPQTFRYNVKPLKWLQIDGTDTTVLSNALPLTTPNQATYIVDFGRNIPAHISLFAAADAGDTITIVPYENITAGTGTGITYVCKNGLNTFDVPFLSVFRFLKVYVHARNRLQHFAVSANYTSYPVNYTGNFTCSNPFYNKLWATCRQSLQMCMNDMFFDSPQHQEPLGCTGDYFIESLSNYYAFGDPWLVRQTLYQTAKMLEKNGYQQFHTSYSMLYVQMVRKYVEYTGDTSILVEIAPQLNKLMDRFETYLDKNYLMSNAPNYMFLDWIKIDEFNAHHPPAVIGMGYMTAFYYKGLQDAIYLNNLIQNTNAAVHYATIAPLVKQAINQYLWDDKKQLYKDGIPFITAVKPNDWLPADKDITTYSPHINALSVLYNIAPQKVQDSLVHYVVSQQQIELQPYFMFFVLDAINHTGKFDNIGLSQINRWKGAIDTTTQTLKEAWNNMTSVGYGGDFSHAWGSAPLYYLSKTVLGISPAEPGYTKLLITPYVSDSLTWAKGSVQLNAHDAIQVSWVQTANDYQYTLQMPVAKEAVLAMPKQLALYGVLVNGTAVTSTEISLVKGENKIEFKRK